MEGDGRKLSGKRVGAIFRKVSWGHLSCRLPASDVCLHTCISRATQLCVCVYMYLAREAGQVCPCHFILVFIKGGAKCVRPLLHSQYTHTHVARLLHCPQSCARSCFWVSNHHWNAAALHYDAPHCDASLTFTAKTFAAKTCAAKKAVCSKESRVQQRKTFATRLRPDVSPATIMRRFRPLHLWMPRSLHLWTAPYTHSL